MKIKKYITTCIVSLSLLVGFQTAQAEKQAGPNGGRVIESVTPHAEFFVTPDRYAQITFVDADGAAVEPEEQVVSLLGGDRSAPVHLTFELTGTVLRSTEPLPEIPGMPIILTIKPAADAKSVRERFYLHQHKCGSCDYEEYACICGH